MAKTQDWEPVIQASLSDIRRLDDVIRYSSIPVVHHELVSTHTFWVALHAAMIHQHVNPKYTQILGPLLIGALTHDAGESVTGDVVRTFKYSSPSLKEEIDKAEEKLSEKFPWEIRQLFTLSQVDDPVTAKYIKAIIKAADFLSLFQYMRREALRRNLEIIPFYDRMVADLTDMAITNNKIAIYPGEKPGAKTKTKLKTRKLPYGVNPFLPEDFYFDLSAAAAKVAEVCFPQCLNDQEKLQLGSMRIV